MTTTDLLQLYLGLGLIPIPLKPRSKEPLMRWSDGWNPRCEDNKRWPAHCDLNWPMCSGPNLVTCTSTQ